MTRWGRSLARRHASVTAAGLLTVATLTGCSMLSGADDPPPVAAETASPSPTVAQPAAPVLPAPAKQATKSGAVAFTYYWFAAYNHATVTLTSAELKPTSDPTCVFCNRAQTTIDKIKSDGHTAEGGKVTITAAKVAVGTVEKGMRVNITYDQAASTIKDSNGVAISTKPAAKAAQAAAAVKWTGKQWVVLEIVVF